MTEIKKNKLVTSRYKLKKLQKVFQEEAEKLGLMENFLFATRFNEYCRQLDWLEELNAVLEKEGLHEFVPVGRDGEKRVTHHSYGDYLKTDANCQKIATYLRDSIEKAGKNFISARPAQEADDLDI